MNRTPPPASPQQRAAPSQQHPAADPVPGAARMPSAAPLQAAGGSQQAVPAGISATAIQPQSSPQNLGIDPVAANDNDSRFGFEWKSRAIGSNHTWGCVVSAAEGEAISVRVAQLPYDRTLRGVGAVEVIAIPVAPVGTRGTLMARNESTGAVAEFNWTWSPFKPRFTAARPKTVPSGKPPPPTGGVAAAPSAKAATERQAITTGAPTQAEQKGVVGAAALKART